MRSAIGTLAAAVALLPALALVVITGARAETANSSGAIEQGRSTFNSHCAHCHGEDAAAAEDCYNLPQLLSEKNDAFFFTTVSKGIADKGMPPWKGVLKRREIANILAFLRSLEAEQGLGESGGGNN
jgi:mono/diheme cytochrome c family protein